MILKKFVFSFMLILCIAQVSAQGEKFQFHKVQAGETVFSLCKKYNISESEFFKFNPQAKNGIRVGELLMVPVPKEDDELPIDTTRFLKHTVQDGETIYSLCKKYNVVEDELINLNPYLKDKPLQLGSSLIIPRFPKQNPVKTTPVPNEKMLPIKEEIPSGFHKVKEGETLFSIAKLYDTKVSELLRINTQGEIENGIRVGQVIKVKPENSNLLQIIKPIESLATDTGKEKSTSFKTYRVQEGDTEEDILERFDLEKEAFYMYNPEIKKLGFKKGTLLIIPKKLEKKEEAKKGDSISDYSGETIRVLLLLPIDDLRFAGFEDRKSSLSKPELAGFEFYTGFKIALDSLEMLGYHMKVQVQYLNPKETDMKKWAEKEEVRFSDIIFGPFYTKQAESLADFLAHEPIKIISPLSKNIDLNKRPVLYNSQPDDQAELQALAELISSNFLSSGDIYLIGTGKESGVFKIENLESLLTKNQIPFKKIISQKELVAKTQLTEIGKAKPAFVVCLSDDRLIMSDLVSKLALMRSHDITLMGRSTVLEIPTVEQRYLNRLKFTTVESSYINSSNLQLQSLRNKFNQQFEVEPTKYALHGFDLTFYFVQALYNHSYESKILSQTGFSFYPTPEGGFRNTFLLPLQIHDFQLKVLPKLKETFELKKQF